MTKEEYLEIYKDDRLAEILAHSDEEGDKLISQIAELGKCVGVLNKKCEELDIWDDTDKVFAKLKSLPAKDFINLYYLMQSRIMQSRINNHERYENTCILNQDKWDSISATISSR